MSKLEVGRGAAYLYAETITTMFGGYIFWLVISKLASTEIIGTYATIVSLANIIVTVVTFGIPNGIQRFLGKSFAEQKVENSKVWIKVSLVIVTVGLIISSIITVILRDLIYEAFKFDLNLLIVLILFMSSTSIYTLFRFVIIATLKTKRLTIVTVISTIIKFAVAVILAFFGAASFGVAAGVILFPLLLSILLGLIITTILKSSAGNPNFTFGNAFKKTFAASVGFWIPSVISIVGSQLGTIIVKGSQGSTQAAQYFIALSIVTGISAIMSVLSTISYPAAGAMYDGRKRFARRITKISLILTLPFSSTIAFYSKEIMGLFGSGYVEGSFALELLLFSIFPTAIYNGINILVYSYGNYRQVLLLGIAVSVPRTLFYFILVPSYGGSGAALSYLIGSLVGLLFSIIFSKIVKMQFNWKDLVLILIIPTVIAFVLHYLHMNYILGIILSLAITYILLLRLHIIDRIDLKDAIELLPPNTRNSILPIVSILAKKFHRFF